MSTLKVFILSFMILCFLPAGRGGFLWPGLNVPILKEGAVQNISRRSEAEQQEVQAELCKHKRIYFSICITRLKKSARI